MPEYGTEKKLLGKFSLTLTGITCIIGSGWLFGIAKTAQTAGPAAIISWGIGGIVILLIALPVAELGTIFPKSGGMVNFMNESHGPLCGFIGAWASWLSIIAIVASEAAASVQYLFSWRPTLEKIFFNSSTQFLTPNGLILGIGLLVLYSLINYWSLKLFMKVNNYIVLFKIIIPVVSIFVF